MANVGKKAKMKAKAGLKRQLKTYIRHKKTPMESQGAKMAALSTGEPTEANTGTMIDLKE